VNTILLKKAGLLAQYKSPSAESIPDEFVDPEGYWTAFGARARVFIVNTDLVAEGEEPTTYEDFLDPKWKGKCGISKPLGGTTATHAAALAGRHEDGAGHPSRPTTGVTPDWRDRRSTEVVSPRPDPWTRSTDSWTGPPHRP